MSLGRVRSETLRKEGSLRIFVVSASPSCRLTVAAADSASESINKFEIIEGTQAELDQHPSDSWDLVITHIHQPRSEYASIEAPAVEAETLGDVLADVREFDLSRARSAQEAGRPGIFGRLFRRKKLSAYEREEHRATRTVVLAEIQREIGVALSAIEMGDFDTIEKIAVRLKDDGATYNFAKLSGLGAALYDTVPNRDIRTARNIAQKLMTYMGKAIGSHAA